MAVVRVCGFEMGDSGDRTHYPEAAFSATNTSYITDARTGAYAAQVNPATTGVGTVVVIIPTNTGQATSAILAQVASGYVGFAFRPNTLPASASEEMLRVQSTAIAAKCNLRITSTGLLALYGSDGTTLIVTGTTPLSPGRWVYVEIFVDNAGTPAYEVRINGRREFAGTSASIGASGTGYLSFGKTTNRNGNTVSFDYDDIYIDDAQFLATTTRFPEVKILIPNAAGGSAGWTNGTGSTFAEVDDVPPDLDTTYIQASATQDNTYSTFRCQNCNQGEISGTILAVQGTAFAKTTSTSGTSTVNQRMRIGSTNSDLAGLELSTIATGLHQVLVTNPENGNPWTRDDVDRLEIGMNAGTIAQVQRFTQATLNVLSLPYDQGRNLMSQIILPNTERPAPASIFQVV